MAGAAAKKLPVGSSEWIQNERVQTGQYVAQEAEEFGFSVRNEMEWLNEHMAEIFSKGQVYINPSTSTFTSDDANQFVATSPMYSKHQVNYAARHLGLHASKAFLASDSH